MTGPAAAPLLIDIETAAAAAASSFHVLFPSLSRFKKQHPAQMLRKTVGN